MKSDWKKVKLSTFVEPSKKSYKPNSGEYKYFGLEHLDQGGFTYNGYGSSSTVESNKFFFEKDDILFGKLRPYFRKVVKAPFSGICSTDIWVLRAKEGNDQAFAFYYIANQEFVDYVSKATSGTRMPRADWSYIKDKECEIPPLPVQQSIAQILSSLDDKIGLLREQNKTLEALAQTLFKRWFVDFEFPNKDGKPYKSSGGKMAESELGLIPEGWRVYELKELVSHLKPGTNSQPERQKSGIPFVNGRNVKEGVLDLTSVTYITREEYDRVHKTWKPEKNDILITRIGTLGNVGIIRNKDLPCAVHYNSILIKGGILKHKFIYFLLTSASFQEKYHLNKKQAVQEFVTIETVEQIKIAIPKYANGIHIFNPFESMFDKFVHNTEEIDSQKTIRDLLLPKLMKGEIEV